MQVASNRSPFASGKADEPWLLWQKREAVDDLPPEHESRPRTMYEEHKQTSVHEMTFPIQRNQYHAIIGRMKQAKKQTGSFSTWTP